MSKTKEYVNRKINKDHGINTLRGFSIHKFYKTIQLCLNFQKRIQTGVKINSMLGTRAIHKL